jgi:hypothetical protein
MILRHSVVSTNATAAIDLLQRLRTLITANNKLARFTLTLRFVLSVHTQSMEFCLNNNNNNNDGDADDADADADADDDADDDDADDDADADDDDDDDADSDADADDMLQGWWWR